MVVEKKRNVVRMRNVERGMQNVALVIVAINVNCEIPNQDKSKKVDRLANLMFCALSYYGRDSEE